MTPTGASSTFSRRRQDSSDEPENLFRPPSISADATLALLNRVHLTDEETIAFLEGRPVNPDPDQLFEYTSQKDRKAYHDRRRQIREWASQVESGATEMDEEHMRLVPTRRPEPPGVPLPPVAARAANQVNVENEEVDRRWLEREEREAAEAISRAVRRYRQQGVPEDQFELVRIRPREQNGGNLTFRRICCAVLAVVTAFVCVMLQTLPLMNPVSHTNPIFDKLMWELLHVREFEKHALRCPGLHRESTQTWVSWFPLFGRSSLDCSDGVLHIPAGHVIAKMYEKARTDEILHALSPYTEQGINVSWFLPCHLPSDMDSVSNCYPGKRDVPPDTCALSCFRGIHDGLVSSKEVDDALRMGAQLIKEGGDHFDILDNVQILSKWTPRMLVTLRQLLRDQYNVMQSDLVPVAFRVSIALPMDGSGVPLYGSKSTNPLVLNINRTNYLEWMEASARQNDRAAYSLPPPFHTRPIRDACNLMADLEADPEFAIHTAVYLSDAAGHDYTGGAALYVDDHPSNSNRRRKVRRGVTIDGVSGRIVVSTGGIENRRCRLPTRAGARAMLQIWWGCGSKS